MFLRRSVQLVCLVLFLGALASAAFSFSWFLPRELFLELDPVLIGGSLISLRTLTMAVIPILIVLVSALFLGRAFCGYVCPMGTTLDGSDKLWAKPGGEGRLARLRPFKYWILLFILGSALAGISFVFLASPMSLITRFYGLLILPILALLADQGLLLAEPLIQTLDISSLIFAEVRTPRFATQFFVLAFFGALFVAAKASPRFWCRYLCPTGALLGLLSKKPLIRRRVSEDCTDCGLCQKSCPMGAIPEDPLSTAHGECLVCRTCQEACPVEAIGFAPKKPIAEDTPALVSPGRRGFILATMTGLATGLIGRTSLQAAVPGSPVGTVKPPGLLRPPGTLPEHSFLAACVRCGECVVACPTNTLQPIWLQAGLLGLFSPALTPRRAFCDPHCHACADACPTGAVRETDLADRVWAKTGTAMIIRQTCLAWEHDKKCLVCDEVCPFDAIDFRPEPGQNVTVPHVIEDSCAGCGYCEHHCPVQNRAAIVIRPQGQIRLAQGSFEEEAKARGLSLSLKENTDQPDSKEGYPYPQNNGKSSGFDD